MNMESTIGNGEWEISNNLTMCRFQCIFARGFRFCSVQFHKLFALLFYIQFVNKLLFYQFDACINF